MEAIERQLDRARQGDSRALSRLYKRFLPGVFGSIATRVPARAIAEDLTSEVFLQMIEGIHRLRAKDEAGFVAWLLRIARVVVAGYSRKREKNNARCWSDGRSWDTT
jgi:RNA polymerase sigma-70 factor, ECF subfamily